MEDLKNTLTLSGVLLDTPVFHHDTFGEKLYTAEVSVERLSGTADILPVTIPESLLLIGQFVKGSKIAFEGQIRTYNKLVGNESRLVLTCFVQRLLPHDTEDNANRTMLYGTICRPTTYRVTPFGREVCDLMVAVNRAYGKSDYIPCVAWGRTAQYSSRLQVGDKVSIQGRVQSRKYDKLLPDGSLIRRDAYEVSVVRLSKTIDLPDFDGE